MKKSLKYICLFFLPIVILDLALLIKCGYANFSNQFIVGDMQSQYVTLVAWLQNVLNSDSSLFYSFSKGIGGNMFATFAYYLSSPLNILLLLFDKTDYVQATALLIHIKIGLSSIAMYIFLKYKFKEMNFLNLTIFSITYALSGALINLYSNIMWLDIAYFTPLVIIGLDKIVHAKESYLYIIFLALAIMSNFYMGYMLCIFCIIYYIYETALTYTKNDKTIIINNTRSFILYSLVAALISCIILVPLILDMQNMFRYTLNKPVLYFDFDTITMIVAKLFIGSMEAKTIFSHTESNIYVGLFSLMLVVLFFFNKKIKKKEKIVTGTVILFFLISILFNAINLIWHGFSFPNGYNYRYVFFSAFFLVMIASKQFLTKTKIEMVPMHKTVIFCVVFLLIGILLSDKYSYLSVIKVVINLFFVIIYLFSYINKEKIKKIFILFIVMIELGINVGFSFVTKDDMNTWYKEEYNGVIVKNFSGLSNELCSFVKEDINYRLDTANMISYNDGFLCNYGVVNTALSTNHARYYRFMDKVGISVTYSTIKNDYENGPFVDSILGLQSIYKTNQNYQPYYIFNDSYEISSVNEFDIKYTMYENPYALSIGYVIDENIAITFNNNTFEYQNELAKIMSGLNINIFEKVQTKKIDTGRQYIQSLSFYAENKNYYIYNYVPTPINTTYYGDLVINEDHVHQYVAGDNGIVALEEHVVGKDITVTYVPTEEYKEYVDLQIYSFNKENFERVIERLKRHQLNVTKREGNVLEGNITVPEDSSLMMVTVPYEKGWNIYVDGKKVDYEEVYDTFVGVRLDEGEHEIKMVFYSPGLGIGCVLSLIGLSLFGVIVYKDKKEGKKNGK